MRPAIGFCIPRRCLLRCNLLVKAAPLRPACFPSLQPPTARRQLQHLYATPENDQNIDEDDVSVATMAAAMPAQCFCFELDKPW